MVAIERGYYMVSQQDFGPVWLVVVGKVVLLPTIERNQTLTDYEEEPA